MDARDRVLQETAPTLMVPRFTPLEPLSQPGHRFLAAANGEWLEIMRTWLYARVPLSAASCVAKPYGSVTGCLEWLCPPIPLSLFERFAAQAKACSPVEAAAWITWDENSGDFALREVGVRDASATRIHFDRPRLEEGEHLVVDLHSHGAGPPFFSATDDADDRGEVKLSVVLGHCDRSIKAVHRLCVLGAFIPVRLKGIENGGLCFETSRLDG